MQYLLKFEFSHYLTRIKMNKSLNPMLFCMLFLNILVNSIANTPLPLIDKYIAKITYAQCILNSQKFVFTVFVWYLPVNWWEEKIYEIKDKREENEKREKTKDKKKIQWIRIILAICLSVRRRWGIWEGSDWYIRKKDTKMHQVLCSPWF